MGKRGYRKFQNRKSQKRLPNFTKKVWAKGLMKGSKQKQPQSVKNLYKNVLSRRCYQIFKGNKT